MQEPVTDLLNVSVSPDGIAALKRITGSTRWLFITGISCCLLLLIDMIIRASFIDPEKYKGITSLYWQLKLTYWFAGFYILLLASQLYLYLRFVLQINKGLRDLDSYGFNNAFRLLQRSNMMAICPY